jgi:hypothetical protein
MVKRVNKQHVHTPHRERRLWFFSPGERVNPPHGEERVRPDGRALFYAIDTKT